MTGKPLSYRLPKLLMSLLNSHNLDLKSLAWLADIPASTLYKNIKGITPITLSNALKVCNAFNLDAENSIKLMKELI